MHFAGRRLPAFDRRKARTLTDRSDDDDTEREPGMSSAGSATVAANLVTCAIGEETVVSIRWPAAVNSLVGLAPTQELVSRDGMMGAGLVMRTGPMCRNVEDSARILDVIAA